MLKHVTMSRDLDQLKQIIEAALLAAGQPLTLERLMGLFADEQAPPSRSLIRTAIDSLMADCRQRGVELIEVSSGFRYQVKASLAPWVGRLWEEKPAKYSRAVLETLALIAYRQPVTRGEIEEVRGVSVSSHIMKSLLEREWVRVIGYRDVPGKPALYGTTRQFLDYFNLKSLSDLPDLADIRSIETIERELLFDSDVSGINEVEGPATDASQRRLQVAIASGVAVQRQNPKQQSEAEESAASEVSALQSETETQ